MCQVITKSNRAQALCEVINTNKQKKYRENLREAQNNLVKLIEKQISMAVEYNRDEFSVFCYGKSVYDTQPNFINNRHFYIYWEQEYYNWGNLKSVFQDYVKQGFEVHCQIKDDKLRMFTIRICNKCQCKNKMKVRFI